jgi:hypothetical protein
VRADASTFRELWRLQDEGKRPGNPLAVGARGPGGPIWCGRSEKRGGMTGFRPDPEGCLGKGNAGGPGANSSGRPAFSGGSQPPSGGPGGVALDFAVTSRRF